MVPPVLAHHDSPRAPRALAGPLGEAIAAWCSRPLPATCMAMAMFAAATLLGVILRPLLPIDETRYLTVAWELFDHDNHFRLTLNGEPYGHKPPLLFSLIEELWDLIGEPSEIAARLVPPAFGLACLGLVAALARRLWPARPRIAAQAPFVLLSLLVFPAFAQLVMFDAALTAAVLAGILGLWTAAAGRQRRGWTLFALAVGFGALTKGPVVLVHLLPAALAAPLWHPAQERIRWRGWYGALALALAVGAAIALAWVAMAVHEAGEGFGVELLWRQSAGRVVDAFAHRRPWWFFLALAPLILAPWIAWTPLWRRATWRAFAAEAPSRLLLIWALAAAVLHSGFQSKQLHYVLPLLPAIALLVARRLDDTADRVRALRGVGVAIALGGAGLATAILVAPPLRLGGTEIAALAPWLGPALVAIGVLVEAAARRAGPNRPALLAALALALLVTAEAGAQRLLARFDLAAVLRVLPDPATTPLARLGVDQGEFGYLGRRVVPVASFASPEALRDWAQRHPDGFVVVPVKRTAPPAAAPPFARLAYGANEMWVWRATEF